MSRRRPRLPAMLLATLLAAGAARAQDPQQPPAAATPGAPDEAELRIRLVQVQSDPGRLFPRGETDPKRIPVNPFNPESLRFFFRVR